jgi:hypothetical protein
VEWILDHGHSFVKQQVSKLNHDISHSLPLTGCAQNVLVVSDVLP